MSDSEQEPELPDIPPPKPGIGAEAMRSAMAEDMFGPDASSEPEVPDPKIMIGRYPILETIGSGGMGVVHAAWDDLLDRKVAIKLMDTEGADSTRERARLVREAQALAKLSHPNVVQVYEVGEHEGTVFLAMELVDGVSLREWQRDGRRSWSDLLDVYVQAGRGLAAAHRAGLVHRDFKPANVLVGKDERVRVVDFGLAQGPGLSSASASVRSGLRSGGPRVSQQVTRTGTVVGTPAYMAPEQIRGDGADERADQFSFCVSLYEALFGRRPFEVETLRGEVGAAAPSPGRGQGRAPWWVRRALRRGLAFDRAQRWVSMDALLTALDRGRWQRRMGGLVLAVVTAGALALASLGDDETAQCLQPEHAPAKTWSAERTEVEAAFEASGVPYVVESFGGIDRDLAAYAQRWDGVRAEACESSTGPTERRRMIGCLDRRAEMFSNVVDQLSIMTANEEGRTDELLVLLEPVVRCSDPLMVSGSAEVELPVSVTRAIDEAKVAAAAGRHEGALEQIDELLATARVAEHPAARAEALVARGDVLRRMDDYEAAEVALAQGMQAGAKAHHATAELESFRILVEQAVDDQQDPDKAQIWSYSFAAAVARAGEAPLWEADYLTAMGMLESLRKQHEAAIEHQRRALELQREALGTESHPLIDRTRLRLANALGDGGKLAESTAYYEQVLRSREERLGSEHPLVAAVHFNLALNAIAEGKSEQARSKLERAFQIESDSLGPDSAATARTELMLSWVLQAMGDYERARQAVVHARQVLDAKLPAKHSDRLAALDQLANLELEAKAYPEALRLHVELEALMSEEDPNLPRIWHNLGWLHCQLYACEGAREWAERARATLDELPSDERDPDAAVLELFVEHTLGLIARAEGDLEQAQVHAQRARLGAPALAKDRPEEIVELLAELDALDEPADTSN